MPRRRTTLTTDLMKLAQVVGQAWSGAKAIERRYPRVFASALADAMQLEDEQARAFIEAMEGEHIAIENAKHSQRGFR